MSVIFLPRPAVASEMSIFYLYNFVIVFVSFFCNNATL